MGASWPEAQWAQVWNDLLEAQQAGLSDQLPAASLAAAFLRVLLLSQQYFLAAQLLPACLRQQQEHEQGQGGYGGPRGGSGSSRGGTPTGAMAAAGRGFEHALVVEGTSPLNSSSLKQQAAAYDLFGGKAGAEGGFDHLQRPATAESALSALTGGGAGGGGSSSRGLFGGPAGAAGGGSRFGVRRALHNAAGAAVSSAVSSSAKIMGVSAHLVSSTAHLVGSTAQAVQSGTGGMVGATAGLVSGTASLVSSAAIFAAEAAAKAGSKASAAAAAVLGGSTGGHALLLGAPGLLDDATAEAVVVGVSQELLASAASLEDPAVAAAEAVLCLLPEECEVRLWPAAMAFSWVSATRLLAGSGWCSGTFMWHLMARCTEHSNSCSTAPIVALGQFSSQLVHRPAHL